MQVSGDCDCDFSKFQHFNISGGWSSLFYDIVLYSIAKHYHFLPFGHEA